MPNLTILSGPSCVGKGPAIRAISEFRNNVRFREVPVLKSIESRGGSLRATDNPDHFFPAASISGWQENPNYIVGSCRGFPQAISLATLKTEAEKSDNLYLEAYHTLGRQFRDNATVRAIDGLKTTSVFMSPISAKEIEDLSAAGVNVEQYLTQLMMNKQFVRSSNTGDRVKMSDVASRARDAFDELSSAHLFDGVIVNHDGEGDPNWHIDNAASLSEPEGDACRTMMTLSDVLLGKTSSLEHWTQSTVPFYPGESEGFQLYADILKRNPNALVTLLIDGTSFEEATRTNLSLLHSLRNPLVLAGLPNILQECYFDKHPKYIGMPIALWNKHIEPLRRQYPEAFLKNAFAVDTEDKVPEDARDNLKQAIRDAAIEAGYFPCYVDHFYGMDLRFRNFPDAATRKMAIPLTAPYKGRDVETMYRNRHIYDIECNSAATGRSFRLRLCGQSPVLGEGFEIKYGPDTLHYFASAIQASDVVILRGRKLQHQLADAVASTKARLIGFDNGRYFIDRP